MKHNKKKSIFSKGDYLINELDIFLIIVLSSIYMIFTLFSKFEKSMIGVILQIPLFYFFSGYSLVSFLFPRKDDLSNFERISLYFFTSIVLFSVIGFVMGYIGFEVKLNILSVSLYFFVLFFSLLTLYRRSKIPHVERLSLRSDFFDNVKQRFVGVTRKEKYSFVLLSILLIVSVAFLVHLSMNPRLDEKYSEFYILGPDGDATEVPSDFRAGEEKSMIVRIVNHEHDIVDYMLQIVYEGDIIQKNNLTLEHNEESDIEFIFKSNKAGEKQLIIFKLYRSDNEDILDQLNLYIDVR